MAFSESQPNDPMKREGIEKRPLTDAQKAEARQRFAEQAEKEKKYFAEKQKEAAEAQAQQSQERIDIDAALSEITVLETGPDMTDTVADEPLANEKPRQVEADKPAPKAASPVAPPPSIWKKITGVFRSKP